MRRGMLTVMALVVAATGMAEEPEDVARRFALAFLPYSPGATVEVKVDFRGRTPNGQYTAVTATRSGIRSKTPETAGMIIDPTARFIAMGITMPLPPGNPPLTMQTLPSYVEKTLPQMIGGFLGNRVKIRWPSLPTRPSAVIPLVAEVQSGYGHIRMPLAITADGAYLAMGSTWPMDRDPRAVRREILDGAAIQWDPDPGQAVVRVVEFSDFQCPACKYGWGVAKNVLQSLGPRVHHGLVNYPLYNNHPWALRAAVAGECVGSLWPDKLVPLKEEFYRLQDTITLETVDQAAFGFLSQQSLPEKVFRGCYMKDVAVDKVLRQIDLGQRLGVTGTPTYYCNGEIIPANKEWMTKRLAAIIEAKGLPENAADIQLDPEPTPAPTPKASPAPPKK